MTFADENSIGKGRTFDCQKCPETTKKLRRCGIDGDKDRNRWNFTSKDSIHFPIQLTRGGQFYSFCPGKVSWDWETVYIFRMLIVCSETGTMLTSGGVADQPTWFIELISWFLPIYDRIKFSTKAKMILGDGKVGSGKVGKK